VKRAIKATKGRYAGLSIFGVPIRFLVYRLTNLNA